MNVRAKSNAMGSMQILPKLVSFSVRIRVAVAACIEQKVRLFSDMAFLVALLRVQGV
jgi:hypothetical protein